MASTAVTVAPRRNAVRDPVLLLPVAVAAGLAMGWLGVRQHVSGARIAVDLALAWSLVGASLVLLERRRWRGSRWLLAAAAFALLGGDLMWASTDLLWTLGLLLAWAWAGLLVQFALTFPDGRPRSRLSWIVVVAAYVIAVGGQLVLAFVATDTRNVLPVRPDAQIAHWVGRAQEIGGIAVGLTVLVLVSLRLAALQAPARRAQGPLLVGAMTSAATGVACLSWLLADGSGATTLDTIARAAALTLPLGVVAGMLWSRLGRPKASELVVELGTDTEADTRARLARALGDPTLELAYRLGDGRYVDAAGRVVKPAQGPERAVTALTAGGDEIAILVHDPSLLDEPGLVESVRATAGLVLENERLAALVRSQLAEVRASRGRIVAAADAERRRIERNLHDGAQQRLVTLSIALGREAARADANPPEALARAQDEVEQAIGELRELARGIHPTLLRDEGLEAAVAGLARRTPVPVSVRGSVPPGVPETVALAAYFVVAEALTNVVKHASATEAWVSFERGAGSLIVSVRDDGAGGASISDGTGLSGLRDRLDALDASLSIESTDAQGTTVRAEFPCGP
jgi:signal transduction histidine kinase